ncbi:MAG: ABC transporter ATP-binding protein [Flavobacteriales bacterium]|nr:ABC transporter ATP-binding protein [Flavobacteriales bacterium]
MIRVEGLGKRYVLRHQRTEPYTALRDVIADKARGLFRPNGSSEASEFWALKDVSFGIAPGDRVGIIGRNGAGKSTLLKILSRIVHPTQGRVEIEGRLASLLEVGTGFHPELSGRENIYLNGAILGMGRKEISAKFDEIVAFAEVERFLDTPVKRYSSGMYVRLAFAVAAHLEPEILVVDEVLAVGDAEFQRKCMGKMKEVAHGGRTILFVSHNMAAIQNLCSTAIYLKHGQVQAQGEAGTVITEYLRSSSDAARQDLALRQDRQGNGAVRFMSFSITDDQGRGLAALQCGSPAALHFDFEAAGAVHDLHLAIGIDDELGTRVAQFNNEATGQVFVDAAGKRRITISIPKCALRNGRYTFTLFSSVAGDTADYLFNAGSFDVEDGDFYGTGKLPPGDQGAVLLEHSFSIS